MPPQPILLYRRRWTLVFQVPFVLLMAICLAFSLYGALASNDRLLTILFLCAAFVSFCVGGTLDRPALEAYREQDPAIVIDATGITTCARTTRTPCPGRPWNVFTWTTTKA